MQAVSVADRIIIVIVALTSLWSCSTMVLTGLCAKFARRNGIEASGRTATTPKPKWPMVKRSNRLLIEETESNMLARCGGCRTLLAAFSKGAGSLVLRPEDIVHLLNCAKGENDK